MRQSIDRILLALIVLLPATARAQLVASGPEFQVNSHTTTFESDTYGPRVGAAADGSFVVSWQLGEDDRAAARKSVDRLLESSLERLIVGHGAPITSESRPLLTAALDFLPATAPPLPPPSKQQG